MIVRVFWSEASYEAMKLFDFGKDADYYAQTLAKSLAIQNFLIGRNSLVSETKFLQLKS